MPWRFLVDEDTDTATADELARRGFDAKTVADALGKGSLDPAVAERARREDRVLITTDRHFLDPSLRGNIRVVLVADDGASGRSIAETIVNLAEVTDDPRDLPPVTWI